VEELRESQEICFVNRDGYQEFVAARRPASVRPGNMVTTEGTPVGTHGGIAFYTVGQRRGLGVSAGERRYVVRLDTERNEVVLGSQEDLLKRELIAGDVHWIGEDPFRQNDKEVRLSARIRYRSEAADAILNAMGDRSVHVTFQEPQRAVAPGQSVVFYRDDRVLGGGVIL
jgi:tRNA-specific 2-thiouridylase